MVARIILKTFQTALFLICLFTITGFLGQSSWLLDLTSHFRLLYAPLLLAGALLLALRRCPKSGLVVLGFALLNLWTILPYFPLREQILPAPNLPHIRLVQFNVWRGSAERSQSIAWLKTTAADVIALEECSAKCAQTIQQELSPHGYKHLLQNKPHSLALFSQHPLEPLKEIAPENTPLLAAKLNGNGRHARLLIAHLSRPHEASSYSEEIAALALAVQNARLEGDPVIVAGDLNTTPFSYFFRVLIEATGLVNSQRGFGLSATYPANIPKTNLDWPLPILPIDHVLVTPDVGVLARQNGAHAGSDHLPVVVDLALPKTAPFN